jgi:hypothetical protein
MIKKLIQCCVLGLVLYLIYWLAGLIVIAVHAPAIVLTIILVILILIFIGWLLSAFGIYPPASP